MPDFFSRPVVSNTGPLLALSRIGQIPLLGRLFPEVIIPREVADELVQTPYADVAAIQRELDRFNVLRTLTVSNPLLAAQLRGGGMPWNACGERSWCGCIDRCESGAWRAPRARSAFALLRLAGDFWRGRCIR